VGVRHGALKSALLVAAAVLLVAATPEPGPTCPSPAPPRPEARHASGIALPTPRLFCYGPPVYEPLAKAYGDARMLAESHPNDFGYPWDDRVKRELVISITGPTGEAFARSWMASGATYTSAYSGGTKSTFLPQPVVPVRFRTVTRSYAQLAKLQDDIIEAIRGGLLGDATVSSFGPDDEHNRIVIEVQRLSDASASALASRFGTEAIAVRVDPRSGPARLTGGRFEHGAVDPVVVALILGGATFAVGLAVVVLRRRAAHVAR
jgi:hypothetical protein